MTGWTLLALVPAAATISQRRFMDLRDMRMNIPPGMLRYTAEAQANDVQVDLLADIIGMDLPRRDPLPWLNPLANVLGIVCALFLLRLLIRSLSATAATFREGFDENRDEIRSLAGDEEDRRKIRRRFERAPRIRHARCGIPTASPHRFF